jgi:hypothetical protein
MEIWHFERVILVVKIQLVDVLRLRCSGSGHDGGQVLSSTRVKGARGRYRVSQIVSRD